VRWERHVVEVRKVRDPLPLTEAARLLEVGHDDVDATRFEQTPESVREIDILPGANRCARLLGDEPVGVDVLGGYRLFEPHQVQRLHPRGDLLPRRVVVAGVHVGADVDVGTNRLPGRRHLIHHALYFRRTRRPVELVVLIGVVALIQIELHGRVTVFRRLRRSLPELIGRGQLCLMQGRIQIDADSIAEPAAEQFLHSEGMKPWTFEALLVFASACCPCSAQPRLRRLPPHRIRRHVETRSSPDS
jgi:hypothetical protein